LDQVQALFFGEPWQLTIQPASLFVGPKQHVQVPSLGCFFQEANVTAYKVVKASGDDDLVFLSHAWVCTSVRLVWNPVRIGYQEVLSRSKPHDGMKKSDLTWAGAYLQSLSEIEFVQRRINELQTLDRS